MHVESLCAKVVWWCLVDVYLELELIIYGLLFFAINHLPMDVADPSEIWSSYHVH
jgi:hypothetical protein